LLTRDQLLKHKGDKFVNMALQNNQKYNTIYIDTFYYGIRAITALSKAILIYGKVKYLYIKIAYLGDSNVSSMIQQLSTVIQNNRELVKIKIEWIDFNNNSVKDNQICNGIIILLQALGNIRGTSALKSLSIKHHLNESDIKKVNWTSHMLDVINNNQLLEYLKIRIMESGQLISLVKAFVNITKLILFESTISYNDCQALIDAYQHKSLVVFKLDHCRIEDYNILADFIKLNHDITLLTISHCRMDDANCIAIVEALMHNGNIEQLELDNNDILIHGAHSIAKLISCSKISRLDISSNSLGIIDMSTIIKLKSEGKLQAYLDSLVGDSTSGLIAIIKALTFSSTEYLKLDNYGINGIRNNVIIALSAYLQYNNSLKHLSLSNCGITDDMLIILLDALKYNKILKTLYLTSYYITIFGYNKLFEFIKQHPFIQFTADYTDVEDVNIEEILNSAVKQLKYIKYDYTIEHNMDNDDIRSTSLLEDCSDIMYSTVPYEAIQWYYYD
jgi:hypothetical protein